MRHKGVSTLREELAVLAKQVQGVGQKAGELEHLDSCPQRQNRTGSLLGWDNPKEKKCNCGVNKLRRQIKSMEAVIPKYQWYWERKLVDD